MVTRHGTLGDDDTTSPAPLNHNIPLSKATYDLQRDITICPNEACDLAGKRTWRDISKANGPTLNGAKCTKTFPADTPFFLQTTTHSKATPQREPSDIKSELQKITQHMTISSRKTKNWMRKLECYRSLTTSRLEN